jgi:hypothetical protein
VNFDMPQLTQAYRCREVNPPFKLPPLLDRKSAKEQKSLFLELLSKVSFFSPHLLFLLGFLKTLLLLPTNCCQSINGSFYSFFIEQLQLMRNDVSVTRIYARGAKLSSKRMKKLADALKMNSVVWKIDIANGYPLSIYLYLYLSLSTSTSTSTAFLSFLLLTSYLPLLPLFSLSFVFIPLIILF